eukprot:jgi/Psemu1/293346/fgenesh1_pg.2171_\
MPYRPVYIHEGRVLRDNPNRDGRPVYRGFTVPVWKFVEWKRVAFLVVPIVALWITNPANRFPGWTTPRSQWRTGKPRTTNYGLFSLEETIEGVTLFGLRKQWEVCTFADASAGELCASLADNLCHRKPLFPWNYRVRKVNGSSGNNGNGNGYPYKSRFEHYRAVARNYGAALAEDRVFVAHRFLCACLMLSAVWRFCCPQFPASSVRVLAVSSPIAVFVHDLVASVLWSSSGTTLVRDLLVQNFCVYPCLVELDRLVPRFRRSSWLVRPTGNEAADYAVAVLLLVLGIGGGSNALAGHLVGSGYNYHNGRRTRTLVGYASVAAAALGYAIRVVRYRYPYGSSSPLSSPSLSSEAWTLTLAGVPDRRFGLVHAYWTQVAWIVVGHPREWYPRVVVWLLAGLAGSLWAEVHLEHVELDVVRDLLGWFGLA